MLSLKSTCEPSRKKQISPTQGAFRLLQATSEDSDLTTWVHTLI